jgi:hypothetical protein
MVITVDTDPWGYRIRLGVGPEFQSALDRLKEMVPRRQREYDAGEWFVHKRGEKKLERWISQVQQLGAEVIDRRGQVSSKVA